MNAITTFQNEDFGAVRTTEMGGDPWFVGKDVTDILAYQNGSRDINRHVDEEDRRKIMVFDGNQMKETIVINESGLYSLILSSKMPKAKAFKRWVTSEVLPSIRKHGVYAVDEILDNPDVAIAILQELKEERVRRKSLEQTVNRQAHQIDEMKPKASYCDTILNCKDAVLTSVIAKDYGISATKLNRLLEEGHIQFRRRGIWMLRYEYADQGYTQSKTMMDGSDHCIVWTCWTQKGRLFIYNFLKTHYGMVPLIESQKTA